MCLEMLLSAYVLNMFGNMTLACHNLCTIRRMQPSNVTMQVLEPDVWIVGEAYKFLMNFDHGINA